MPFQPGKFLPVAGLLAGCILIVPRAQSEVLSFPGHPLEWTIPGGMVCETPPAPGPLLPVDTSFTILAGCRAADTIAHPGFLRLSVWASPAPAIAAIEAVINRGECSVASEGDTIDLPSGSGSAKALQYRYQGCQGNGALREHRLFWLGAGLYELLLSVPASAFAADSSLLAGARDGLAPRLYSGSGAPFPPSTDTLRDTTLGFFWPLTEDCDTASVVATTPGGTGPDSTLRFVQRPLDRLAYPGRTWIRIFPLCTTVEAVMSDLERELAPGEPRYLDYRRGLLIPLSTDSVFAIAYRLETPSLASERFLVRAGTRVYELGIEAPPADYSAHRLEYEGILFRLGLPSGAVCPAGRRRIISPALPEGAWDALGRRRVGKDPVVLLDMLKL